MTQFPEEFEEQAIKGEIKPEPVPDLEEDEEELKPSERRYPTEIAKKPAKEDLNEKPVDTQTKPEEKKELTIGQVILNHEERLQQVEAVLFRVLQTLREI